MTTLAEFRTAIRDRLGVPSDDGLFDDTTLTRLVNRAIKKVESENDWAWLEKSETITTVASTRSYSVASDYVRTMLLVDGEFKPLRQVTIDEAEWWGNVTTGRPAAYAQSGRTVVMVPTPDGSYDFTHRYIGSETTLSGDTDEPLAPEPWHESIIEYAVFLSYRRANNSPEAAATLDSYKELIKTMIGRADEQADSRGGGVVPKAAAPATPPAPGA